jgi:hypothetical protein
VGKKVGVITLNDQLNYGAVLQRYALQEVLRHFGHDDFVIDYRPPRKVVRNGPFVRRVLAYLWFRWGRALLSDKQRIQRSVCFSKDHISTSRPYASLQDLAHSPPQADAYITGSDQVWSPVITNGDSAYFLSFAPKGTRTIAYGGSFGVSALSPHLGKKYAQLLKEIDFLSVREEQAQTLVKQLCQRDATLVLDPTLLLDADHWIQCADAAVSQRPYVLCYYMPGDVTTTRQLTKVARALAREHNLDIISVGQREYARLNPLTKTPMGIGPREWLRLIHDAAFVVTNSFHGTAFSVNFSKQFYSLYDPEIPVERNCSSRLISFLGALGLESRLVSAHESFSTTALHEYDPYSAQTILRERREESLAFLKQSLA